MVWCESSILGSPFWFGGGGGGGYYDTAPNAQGCDEARGGGGGGAEGYSQIETFGEPGADVLGNMIGYDATDTHFPSDETTQPVLGIFKWWWLWCKWFRWWRWWRLRGDAPTNPNLGVGCR